MIVIIPIKTLLFRIFDIFFNLFNLFVIINPLSLKITCKFLFLIKTVDKVIKVVVKAVSEGLTLVIFPVNPKSLDWILTSDHLCK